MTWKVFYWDNILENYTTGMAVVVARSKEEAIKQALKEWGTTSSPTLERDLRAEEPTVYPVNELNPFIQEGGS